MQDWIKGACVVLAVAMAGPLMAQDTATETEAEAEAETGETPPEGDASGLAMGAPETEPLVGEPFVRDTFGDWELRCVKGPQVAEICQLYQLLRDGDGNSVAEFNLFPLPEGGQAVAGANIVTPLETLLTAQLRLAVDDGQAKRYPYSFCSQVGCFARIGLTGEEVGLFRAGNTATVTIVPAAAPGETVDLGLSLTGFTAGYTALVASEKARAESTSE